jgi:hypothetical protein
LQKKNQRRLNQQEEAEEEKKQVFAMNHMSNRQNGKWIFVY